MRRVCQKWLHMNGIQYQNSFIDMLLNLINFCIFHYLPNILTGTLMQFLSYVFYLYHYSVQCIPIYTPVFLRFNIYANVCVNCAVLCCVLCAVCCVLCAVCCVLCAVCCVLCAVCCVLCAVLCCVGVGVGSGTGEETGVSCRVVSR
jgi:hypothetical protein